MFASLRCRESERTFIECAISATNSGRNTALASAYSPLRLEDYVAGPFADTKMKQQTRAALLAGTMMSVIAAAPASMAAERQATSAFAPAPMVLAQAVVNPIDQQQQKGKGPPPKGQPPAAIQRTAPPPVR